MATDKNWLDTLDQATSYRELQAAFSQIFAEATATVDPTPVCAAIDEAIRRIEQERTRDQAELDSFSADYDSFKQQQSGVIGWFKRKMPFTETRRQELEHREAVGEQQAEILADNFVIARAQMLKERILPATLRRMGNTLNDWQRRLLANDSPSGIREYGKATQELGQSLTIALAFIQSIQVDMEAFAAANFANKEDRGRRDTDLAAARGELKALQDEVHNKDALRKSALQRLCELIHDELTSHDPAFRLVADGTLQLQEVVGRFPTLTDLVGRRLVELKTLVGKLAEIESIPRKLEAMEADLRSLRRESEDTEHRSAQATRELEAPSQRYETALQESQQAKAALHASKSIYEAYLAEQNETGVAAHDDRKSTSPVVAEYERLQLAASQAEENLGRLTPDFELAKSKFEKAKNEVDANRKKIEQQSQSHSKLVNTQSQLRDECQATRDKLQWLELDFRNSVQTFAAKLQGLHWLANFAQLHGVPRSLQYVVESKAFSSKQARSIEHDLAQELHEFKEDQSNMANFARSLQADQEFLRQELAKQLAIRKAALQRRSMMLLDDGIANELKFD